MCSRFLRSPPILLVAMLLMVAMVLTLMNSYTTIPRTTTLAYAEEAVYVQAKSQVNYDQNVVYAAVIATIENANPFNWMTGTATANEMAAGPQRYAQMSEMSYLMMVTYGPAGGRANAIPDAYDAYPNPFNSYPNPFNQTV